VNNSIVLLSGGMDSAYAALWACRNTIPKAFLWFDYGQRGYEYEAIAAKAIHQHCEDHFVLPVQGIDFLIAQFQPWNDISAITLPGADLDPEAKDPHGRPATFLPGRNLILLSMAAGMAYHLGANRIVGGWCQVDSNYPDCTAEFLQDAQRSINAALGFPRGTIRIATPALYFSKAAIVKNGTRHHVPWGLTRSCYGDDPQACGECDSCLKRAKAFAANGMQDPAYSLERWNEIVIKWAVGGAGS
jgi:7-cyano-7-deazaguanine synthase